MNTVYRGVPFLCVTAAYAKLKSGRGSGVGVEPTERGSSSKGQESRHCDTSVGLMHDAARAWNASAATPPVLPGQGRAGGSMLRLAVVAAA